MSYEPSGIFTEGRSFDFGQEAGCGTIEPSKRARKKNGPFKCCSECGERYQWQHKSSRELYCGIACGWNAKRRFGNERAKCLACHALVGMTCAASGKMVAVVGAVISLERKKRGIIGGSYKLASKVSHMKRMNHPDYVAPADADTSAMEYTRACMKSIRQARIGFDWSYLWFKQCATKKSIERWRGMTNDQKLAHGRSLVNTPEKRCRKQGNHNKWKRKKRKEDPTFAIIESFRARLCKIIPSKDETTKELIGCTPDQLRRHLESQFKRGMRWDNYGSYWHVDHILPVASFDHAVASQRMQCWHWSNLQPLEARENMRKSDKVTHPQMSLMLCSTH